MNHTFDEEMFRLIANPYKLKKKETINTFDDIFYKDLSYKFKNFTITKKKFDNILIIIEKYLQEESIKDLVEEIIDTIIKNVSPAPGYIEVYDERRNPRTLRKSRTNRLHK